MKRILAFLGATYVIWTLRAFLLLPLEEQLLPSPVRQVGYHAIRALLWLVPIALYLRRFERRGFLAAVRLSTPARPGSWATALLLMGIYLGGTLAIDAWLNGRPPGLSRAVVVDVLGSLPSMLLGATMEEVLFRGFILERFLRHTTFARANASTSLLFILIHWPGWLSLQGFHPGLFAMSASLFALSCFLGYLARRTESLWPAVLMHTLNNVVASFPS